MGANVACAHPQVECAASIEAVRQLQVFQQGRQGAGWAETRALVAR